MDYGIAVRNKYELFFDDEDADPLEILRLQEEENAKKKDDVVKGRDGKPLKDTKSAKNKKNNKALSSTQDQKNKSADSKDIKKEGEKPLRNKPRNDDRNNRPRENRERDLPPRRLQQQNENRPSSGFGAPATSPQSNNEFRDRGRGRGGEGGRGRGRGGRGGRGGFDRFGKREFERHSGSDKTSGIKATEKREGGGGHNWGSVKDEIDEQINPETTEETARTEDIENQQPVEGAPEGEGEESAAPVEDESEKEMTLDEYKALQMKKKQAAEFNVRKPGEGCDNSQWKKTYALKKKPLEDSDEEEDSDDEDYEDDRKKKYVPIEITFGDQSRRGGGGRGGGRGGRGGPGGSRGGPRGGGPRGAMGGRGGGSSRGGGGGDRGGRKEQAPNVEDELDFPTLGK